MRTFLTLLLLAAICVGVFALGNLRRESDGKPMLNVAEDVALTVDTAKPERGRIIRLVQAPGDVEPVLEVEISSEIVAKIEEMPVEEGDLVKKGDLLCRLDDNNLLAEVESAEARIAQLKATIRQAEADLEKAERDFERQKDLSESDATSRTEMQDYLTALKKARALRDIREQELKQAQAMLKRMHEDLKRTIIDSPIDGIVAKLNAKQGEVVITGTMNNPGTVIMTIADLSRMQVRARVDEVDVPLVRPDQKARVYLQSEPDVPVPARVVRVASKGTRAVGRDVVTFEALLAVLSTEDRIMPGMTANVEIEVAERDDAITVPVEAVVHRMRKDLPEDVIKAFDEMQAGLDLSERARQAQYIKVVYVMEEEEAAVRLVETGIADSRRVELVDGVNMDDSVIIGPYRSLDQLKNGRKVALAEEDKEKADTKEDGETDEHVAEGKGDTDKNERKSEDDAGASKEASADEGADADTQDDDGKVAKVSTRSP